MRRLLKDFRISGITIGISVIICFMIINIHDANAQGCVAIRSFSGCSGTLGSGAELHKGDFLIGTNFRYFKSFRHFRGNVEETHRIEEGTQVINNSYFLDLSINYGLSNRFYLNMITPFAYHARSSMYEHGGNPPKGLGQRYSTTSRGLSDIRSGIGFWLVDPAKMKAFNYALEIGMKLPTGSYKYKDTFHNQGENKDQDIETVVDQSIQLGDGGFGFTATLQGYQVFLQNFMVFTNLYYMINPQETNGVLTRNGRSEFSCPDQYAARLGIYYMTPIDGFSAYIGGRWEGVPSKDLIGKSGGYRRPGYVLSTEPGLNYDKGKMSFNLTIPLAIERNRTQSFQDKVSTKENGKYKHGDAAFADYLINFSISYKLEKKIRVEEHL